MSRNLKIHESSVIFKGAIVIGDVEIAENCGIFYNSVLRGDIAKIKIGKNSNIQDCCIIHGDPGFDVEIGENVSVGHGAIIHGCKIGNNCIIGMGSIILNGVYIPDNTIIGAGSLVTGKSKFSSNKLILGSPAKEVRDLREEDIKSIKENANEYALLLSEQKSKIDL